MTGLEIATKTGYSRIQAPRVIDATVYGKLAQHSFNRGRNAFEKSVLHVIFNGVEGECTANHVLSANNLGELQVMCRPTYWKEEWRVSFIARSRVTRPEWIRCLPSLLPDLRRLIPALGRGNLTLVSEDVWMTPEFHLHTNSRDDRHLGYVEALDGSPFEIRHNMLGDPNTILGLTLSGTWLKNFPFDPALEERSIVNAFRLGDLAGQSLSGV